MIFPCPNSPAIRIEGISLDFNRDFAGNADPMEMDGISGLMKPGKQPSGCIYRVSNIVNSTTGYEPFKVVLTDPGHTPPMGKHRFL